MIYVYIRTSCRNGQVGGVQILDGFPYVKRLTFSLKCVIVLLYGSNMELPLAFSVLRSYRLLTVHGAPQMRR